MMPCKKTMGFKNVIIVTVGENDDRIHSWGMTKVQTTIRMGNVDLSEKSR